MIVASAGNDGADRPVWPAALPGVVGVGALNRSDSPWKKSNHGPGVRAWSRGVGLDSTFVTLAPRFAGWATWSGTSFAAAHVSGAVAAISTRD